MRVLLLYSCFIPLIFGDETFSNSSRHRRSMAHHKSWQNSGKYQGDIDGVELIMDQDLENVAYNAARNRKMLWPDGIIPYELDPNFSKDEIELLEKSFEHYATNTCIRFEKRKKQRDYLDVIKGIGCYSQVGRAGGKQQISLGMGCLFHEIIIHELMHAVGFWHEHSRSDRNRYIRILWDNILPGMRMQFDKISAAVQNLLNEKYDYRSIMHYDSTAFSRNGQHTLESVRTDFTNIIGTALELSELDIKKINILYRCTSKNSSESVSSTSSSTETLDCFDHFSDCEQYKRNCNQSSFITAMKTYCKLTCGYCDHGS